MSLSNNSMDEYLKNADNMEAFSNRVRECRENAGYRREDMAEAIGIPLQVYLAIEDGKVLLSTDIIDDIARIHNISVETLVFGIGPAAATPLKILEGYILADGSFHCNYFDIWKENSTLLKAGQVFAAGNSQSFMRENLDKPTWGRLNNVLLDEYKDSGTFFIAGSDIRNMLLCRMLSETQTPRELEASMRKHLREKCEVWSPKLLILNACIEKFIIEKEDA